MSHGYNMGQQGRIFHYHESLREYGYERGISNINIQSIRNMANIINRYFYIFEMKYLKDSTKFLGIVESYIKGSCKKDTSIAENTACRIIQCNRE